jgi:putative membrane protein
MIALPLIFATLWYALRNQFRFHRGVARWTFPVWLYVSVTGVIVYLVLHAYAA